MSEKATSTKSPRRLFWKAFLLLLVAVVCVVTVSYRTVPTHNTDTHHFDAIVVLGTPATDEGRPTRAGRWLVDEAIREYKAGTANHVIISGAAVANNFYEAEVLGRYARDSGLPVDAVIEDTRAQNTLQNVQNSADIMHEHGWHSAEVIGLKEHLPRTGVLLQTTSLLWRTHAASTPGRHRSSVLSHTLEEAVGTAVLRIFGLRSVPVLHGIKMAFSFVFHKRP